MPHPDDGLIHAWLDDELDARESARVEALVANDPAWAAAAADARGLIAASSRIMGALDHVPAGVIPRAKTPPSGRAPRWWMTRVAALLLVVAGASVALREREPKLAMQDVVREPARAPAQPRVPSSSMTRAPAAVGRPANQPSSSAQPTSPKTSAIESTAAPKEVSAAREEGARSIDEVLPAKKRRAPVPSVQSAPAAPGTVMTGDSAPTCYIVRLPPALTGRTISHPPDSLSRALWASAGIRPELFVVRGDSLQYSTADSARPIAVRARCPQR